MWAWQTDGLSQSEQMLGQRTWAHLGLAAFDKAACTGTESGTETP